MRKLINPQSLIDVAVTQKNKEFSGANREQQFLSVSFAEFISLSEIYEKEGVSMYMAQCPILSKKETEEEQALRNLILDIKIPKVVADKDLEINL